MTEPTLPDPRDQSRKTGPSLLSIVLIICIFFLFVFVVSVLLLPDHGKSLLKLAETIPVRCSLHA